MAAPRIATRGNGASTLPHPLSPSEALRLRRILALHKFAQPDAADMEIDRLEAPWMTGSLLADRFRSSPRQATVTDLTGWLALYGDLPEAPFIRSLLDRAAPRPAAGAAGVAMDERLTQRARTLFTQNRDAETVSIVLPLLRASPLDQDPSEALFVAGLAARRLDQTPVALDFFQAAHASARSSRLRSAAAFWIARTLTREHDAAAAAVWTRRAAQETDTFHGWIAHRQLGASHDCIAGGTLGAADLDALTASPGGQRAFAWLQVGEKSRAEQELRVLWFAAQPDPAMARALYLVAIAAGLPGFAAEVRADGAANRLAAERQPLERLTPAGGFLVDPTLVYALVRRESNFTPSAVSGAGARGLMQIMPATAQATGAMDGADPASLDDPAINLAVGQKYMLQLAEDKAIDGDLLRLLAAYEQGQYGLRRWVDSVRDGGDPLMFLEALPNQATRHYVEQTLTHAWRYAARFRLTSESLDALAAGRYPRFTKAKTARPRLEPIPANCQR